MLSAKNKLEMEEKRRVALILVIIIIIDFYSFNTHVIIPQCFKASKSCLNKQIDNKYAEL